MRALSDFAAISSRSNEGQLRPADSPRDKSVPRKFSLVARIIWPRNTAAHLAAIARKDERTGKRYLRGELPPPAVIIAAIVNEIVRPGE